MPQALQDLDAIHAYIALESPTAARRWIIRLRERARVAAANPHAGRVVPETERPDVREVFVRTYRIVYRVIGLELHILTVFEGHRQFRNDTHHGTEDTEP